jgi:hypothetical protein
VTGQKEDFRKAVLMKCQAEFKDGVKARHDGDAKKLADKPEETETPELKDGEVKEGMRLCLLSWSSVHFVALHATFWLPVARRLSSSGRSG